MDPPISIAGLVAAGWCSIVVHVVQSTVVEANYCLYTKGIGVLTAGYRAKT